MQREQKEPVMKVAVEYDFRGNHILVVEDNAINLEITSEFLSYAKVEVDTASDGFEAIKKFEISKKGYYDVILMDLQMPELDGYETAKAIRSSSHPDAKSICIIALTADNFSDHQTILDCGMNYHITKPIDINNFYILLQNVLANNNTTA
jgi:CheY-like chemotaxis protein